MCAACRRHELTNMKVEDVQDRGDVIIIKIPDTKTKKPRTSCITEPLWINILKKYKSLRPPGIQHTRFFFFIPKISVQYNLWVSTLLALCLVK
jgi:integrase